MHLFPSNVLRSLSSVCLIWVFTGYAVGAELPIAKIGNNKSVVKLEVAQSTEQIERGLMYRTSMPENSGMVFIFEPPKEVRFWMYHTLIPLDMIFVRDNKIIKIFENVPPCKSENPRDCETYPANREMLVTEVVEVNGGYCQRHGIKEGDPIFFTLGSNSDKH